MLRGYAALAVALTLLLITSPVAGGVAVDGVTLTDEPRTVSEHEDTTLSAQQSEPADGSVTVSADNLSLSVSNESDSVGTFSVTTTRNGTTVPLLAPLDAAPPSYLTVQIDGTNYTSAALTGSSTAMGQFVTERPTAIGDDAILTEWTLPEGVVVTQTIVLDDGTAEFDVTVDNTGGDSHDVNVRFAFDYEVGDRTNPVVVDGEAITTERTFTEPTFDSWYVADKPARPNVAATASVDGQPSAVKFVSRVDDDTEGPTLDTAPYDYPTDPERVVYRSSYNSGSPPGTASPERYYDVASEYGEATGLLYYELGSLEPGGSETVTTNYSLGKQVTTTTPRVVVRDQELGYNVISDRLTVESVFLPDRGFLAVYGGNGELLDVTALLPNETLPTVQFENTVFENQEVTVVGYRDSDGDRTPDPAENATDLTTGDDQPYLVDGEPLVDRANVTIDANTRLVLSAYPFGPFIEGSIVSISAEGQSTPGDEPVPVTQIAGPNATRISDEAPRVIGGGGGGGQFVAPAVDEPTTLVFRANYTDRFGNTVTETIDVVVEPAPATPTASVDFNSVESNGRNATLGDISSTEGGFVAIYDEPPTTAGPEDVIGVTNYVRPGTYDGLLRPGTPDGFSFRTTVPLFDVPGRTFDRESLTETQTLYAVFHRDTDDDRTFDFVSSGGATDQPYVGDDGPVSDETQFTFVPDPQVYWQVDLIGGEPYQRLGPHADNGFYGDETDSEDRLFGFAHGNDVDGLTTRDAAWPNDELRACVETGIELTADDGTASVTFTVAEGCSDVELTFAAYEKPGPDFSRSMNQTLVDAETDSYDPGTHTVTVDLPVVEIDEVETADD